FRSTHAKAAAPPALAGINPAPQVLAPPGQSRCCGGGHVLLAFLWGRLYAGRRSRDPRRGSGPTRAGRDKPGPTGSHPTGPIRCGGGGNVLLLFVGPALCRPTEPRPTPRHRAHPRWPAQPRPPTFSPPRANPLRRRRERPAPFCGAGFMPADGAATHTKAATPPALAGINPAPQVLTPPGQSAAAAAGTSCFFLWGRLYAGRRSRDPHQGSDPTRAGRDKPGPTGSHPTGPIRCGGGGNVLLLFVGPALCRPTEPRPTPRQRPHPRWPG